ncbi:MAG: hypothetical protein KGL46_09115 [Hyphomicrobiales bacterium]|nr:hypothetical protein [Hyphomicrobiales bacterium]
MNTLRLRVIALAAALLAAAPLRAQAAGNPPEPVPRPADLGQTAPPNASPNTSPNTSPQNVAPPQTIIGLDPDKAPTLPPASRAKMHECGMKWEQMKKSGKDLGTTWRQFATQCLTQPDAGPSPHPAQTGKPGR